MKKLLFALILLLTPLAVAAAECGDHKAVTASLAEERGEVRVAQALADIGALMELFHNPETGSWTVLYTVPDNPACIVGRGEHLHIALPPTGAPA